MGKNQENVIFCIDSDGCVMDTMSYKHELFFGPLAAEVFNIDEKKKFLEDWNRVNLYTKTRGINRFVGLYKALDEVDYPNVSGLKQWLDTTPSLSNEALIKIIAENPSDILENTLRWSELVNKQISEYKGDLKAFVGVQKVLRELSKLGRVYVVSSANKAAVIDEWQNEGLASFVDEFFCQNKGKKEDIIKSVKSSNTDIGTIVMIGDSPGDLDAANSNDVLFYPILVNDEEKSWDNLLNIELKFILNGEYFKKRQNILVEQFWKNLS
ncbi:MAG: HAD hydrolase-like protein [Streptococcus sp.]|nr:HAD hydrolase-like protein [Streptococcus sp.]